MYINNKITIIVSVVLTLLASSCVTSRRVNYLQDMTQGSQIEIENRFEATIAPYDELSIVVMSGSAESDILAKPFNLQAQNGQNNQFHNGYLVDVNGDIDMPTLGRIHVAGLTRLHLQDTLTDMLRRGGYIDEPFVNVRFNNFKIFFLGGGTGKVLNIQNERCTFLEALAMMGDVDIHTRRDHIAVMREVDGKMVMRFLDPRSSDVFNDPFFMLQQNDFIITQTMNARVLLDNVNMWMGLGSALLSAGSLVVSILLYQSVNK